MSLFIQMLESHKGCSEYTDLAAVVIIMKQGGSSVVHLVTIVTIINEETQLGHKNNLNEFFIIIQRIR